MIVGTYMLTVAINQPDTLVRDDYYKEGLAINQALERDRQANQLGLSADLLFNPETKLVELKLTTREAVSLQPLTLKLLHPTLAKFDQELTLLPVSNNQYRADMIEFQGGRWYIELEPLDKSWRLKAESHLPLPAAVRLEAG